MTRNHSMPRLLTIGASLLFVAAACGGGGAASPTTAVTTPEVTPAATAAVGIQNFVPDPALLAAAKSEGTITTIALPHDWCGYGPVTGVTTPNIIDTFKARTGLAVNELDPNAGSGDEVQAIKANKDNPGPQAPDVIDVGLSFGPSAKTDGVITPYKVATWDSIPASAKDADGSWYGDYYGVLAFEINSAVVTNEPKDWKDLLNAAYKNQIALAGDPRTSNQAIQTVFAAALANGGSLDNAQPGLDFFKQLATAGNLLPTIAKSATIASGDTPITVRWTYNALANRDTTAASGGPKIDVIVPTSGRFAGVYVQAISKYAPHPNAAKLWMEFLYSDEGQDIWLQNYCHPIRYESLVKDGKIPADQLAKLPDVTGAVFPSLDQLNAAKTLITSKWDATVGVNIK